MIKKLIVFICLFLIGIIVLSYVADSKERFSYKELKSNDNCKGLDIVNTSSCLQKELSKFFFYNISVVGKDIDEYDYKNMGMVCHQATQWYIARLKELGGIFVENKDRNYIQEKDCDPYCIVDDYLPINQTMGHEFVLVSNEEAMCKLDQLKINCWSFK